MKKKLLAFCSLILFLTSCDVENSSSISNGDSLTPSPSVSTNDSVSQSVSTSVSQSAPSTSVSVSNSTNSTPSVNSSASSSVSSSVSTGDSIYPIPTNKNNKFSIGDQNNRTYMPLENVDNVSENINFIYGKNIVKSSSINFYSENDGGGVKMHTNSSQTTYYGFQTQMFEDNWLKLEIDIHIGTMTNNSKKVDEDNPVFTINAYDENGKLVSTSYRENFDMGMKNHDLRIYLSGVNVSYLEILNTNLPYKGSQSYNFAVTGITLTGFPYEYKA